MLFPWQRFCLLLLLLPLLAFSTNAHADSNNVLILHSYHHGFPWTDSIDRGMRSALQNQATNPLIFTEYLDTKRFAPQQRFAELLPYFKRKYARQTFKIILTSDDNAFSFALKNRAQLFPNATIVFCGVNNLAAHDYTRAGNLTGVVEAYDVEGTMRLALKLFPKTRTLALVSDSTPTGEMNLQGALAAQSILGNKVQFLPLSNLSVSKLKAALQNLPPDSLVFNLGFWRDCEQELLTNQQSMQLLVQSSPVPVFALWDFLIGEGTFGGLVVNGETQGATAGALASRLLNGVAVSKLPIIMTSPNTPMFDHQALMRFGLSVRKLPTGSRLINPPDSLLDRYQNFVWPTIGLLAIETLLIALLLLNFIWRRRSEQRLETSEADFKKLIEASPIPLRVSRLGGEIIYVNKQFREMFGYTTEDIPDMPRWFEKAYPDPEYRAQIVVFWNEEVEKNTRLGTPIESRERRVCCKDGSEREIAFGHTQLSELGVTTMFDVTQRNQVLRERKELEQKIQQAQKMESLGVLAGGVAHDFNNLLTGILGGANLTLRRLPANSPLRARVETIAKSAERAAELTRQMLDYSGQGHFVVETLDLNLIVDEMIQLLQSAISKDAMLHINLAQIPVPVEADATQLRQVIMNLITNASDALEDESGVIAISTGVMHADATYLAGSYLNDDLKPGNYAFVEVSDTGNGMTEETMTRIFDPFFTTKFTGRGLGLAAVLGIIRGHQGAVRIYSEPGAGTSFKILFPCQTEALITIKQEKENLLPTDLAERCGAVLIVDDDATVRSVGRMMLEEYGFTVFSAEDGEAGLEQLEQHAQIGLVLLDLTMPKLSGEQVFREIRKSYPQTRVILSSGYNEKDATAHFIGKGLAGFLHKPYRSEDLLQKISTVLAAK